MITTFNDTAVYWHYTPWNDAVMGFKTNEIEKIDGDYFRDALREFETECQSNQVMFTAFRVDPINHVLRRNLKRIGYSAVEISLTASRGLSKFNMVTLPSLGLKIMTADESHMEDVKRIARESFHYGRFFEDPSISGEIARSRNYNWIDDLKNVYVGIIKEKVIGFMAFDKQEDHVKLQLGGVEHNVCAYPFWQAVLLDLKRDCRKASAVISACNTGVMNLYSYFGFKFSNPLIGYHQHRG